MGWWQIVHLRDEMREQIVVTVRHANLYADKVKDASLTRSPAQCATYNTTITFTDDDLLLGSKPHNYPLFITG